MPAVLHAVRWAFAQQQQQQRQYAHDAYGWRPPVGGSRHYPWTPPQIALHVRAMSDFRAKNLTAEEQSGQIYNAMLCVRRAAKVAAGPTASGAPLGVPPPPRPAFLSALVVSSSPELRTQLVKRIASRTRRLLPTTHAIPVTAPTAAAASAKAEGVARGRRLRASPALLTRSRGGAGTEPSVLPLVFDWRHYVSRAPRAVVEQLAASERAAASFCGTVNATDAHHCNRSAHLRDWGPEPHWVAVVELLLLAAVTDVVVGAGFPYFKVCNTFAQIGAALADAAPEWLCALGPQRRRSHKQGRRCGSGSPPRASVRLLCASHVFSTDWGSSMWRTSNATGRRGTDSVIDCGGPACMATPLQPELWDDLQGGTCTVGMDTFPAPHVLFGTQIKPAHTHH